MEWVVDKHAYILRYHMPCDPTYDEETFLRRNYEMIDYCVKNQIPACMIYVDLVLLLNFLFDLLF